MKKLIFIFSFLSIFMLFSFSKKPNLSVNSHMKALSCAKPYNLTATKDNSEVVLSWAIDDIQDLISCSYGGYFNTPNGPVGFSGSTYVWPIRISCPSSATSVHYQLMPIFKDAVI